MVPGAADDPLPDEMVIVAAQRAKALMGEAQYDLGGGEAFAGVQRPAEQVGIDAGHHADGIHLILFDVGAMVAGIDGHDADAVPLLFPGSLVAENDEGIVMMAGCAAEGTYGLNAVHDVHALHLPLHGVAAMEVDELPAAIGEIEGHAGSAVQIDDLFAAVGDAGGAGDDILGLIDAVEQFHGQPGGSVLQQNGKGIAIPLAAVGAGQTLQSVFSGAYLMGDIAQFVAIASVSGGGDEGGHAEIAGVGGGIFLGLQIQRKGALEAEMMRIGGEARIHPCDEPGLAFPGDPAAIVEVAQIAALGELHLVGGVAGLKVQRPVRRIEADAHAYALHPLRIWVDIEKNACSVSVQSSRSNGDLLGVMENG